MLYVIRAASGDSFRRDGIEFKAHAWTAVEDPTERQLAEKQLVIVPVDDDFTLGALGPLPLINPEMIPGAVPASPEEVIADLRAENERLLFQIETSAQANDDLIGQMTEFEASRKTAETKASGEIARLTTALAAAKKGKENPPAPVSAPVPATPQASETAPAAPSTPSEAAS